MLETFKKLPPKKQTSILNAAAHVFSAKGYYRANVSDICRRARISNGALYKYFKNKEDVYLATLDRTVALISEGQARYLPISKSIYDVIYDLLLDVEAFAGTHPNYIVIYLDLGSPSMKNFSDSFSDRIERPSRDFWVAVVEEGKRSLCDRQPRDVVHVLVCVPPLRQAFQQLLRPSGQGPDKGREEAPGHRVDPQVADLRKGSRAAEAVELRYHRRKRRKPCSRWKRTRN